MFYRAGFSLFNQQTPRQKLSPRRNSFNLRTRFVYPAVKRCVYYYYYYDNRTRSTKKERKKSTKHKQQCQS